MTNSLGFRTGILVSLLVSGLLIGQKYFHNRHETFYSLNVIKIQNGWGYDILKNNRAFIHQPFIPAVDYNMQFPDNETARRVGCLVLEKIKQNKRPSITIEELIAMKIIPADKARNSKKTDIQQFN